MKTAFDLGEFAFKAAAMAPAAAVLTAALAGPAAAPPPTRPESYKVRAGRGHRLLRHSQRPRPASSTASTSSARSARTNAPWSSSSTAVAGRSATRTTYSASTDLGPSPSPSPGEAWWWSSPTIGCRPRPSTPTTSRTWPAPSPGRTATSPSTAAGPTRSSPAATPPAAISFPSGDRRDLSQGRRPVRQGRQRRGFDQRRLLGGRLRPAPSAKSEWVDVGRSTPWRRSSATTRRFASRRRR